MKFKAGEETMNYEQRVQEILFATHNCDHQDCATQMPERIQAILQLITEARLDELERYDTKDEVCNRCQLPKCRIKRRAVMTHFLKKLTVTELQYLTAHGDEQLKSDVAAELAARQRRAA